MNLVVCAVYVLQVLFSSMQMNALNLLKKPSEWILAVDYMLVCRKETKLSMQLTYSVAV